MALTERLALIIDAKAGGAISEIKRVDRSLDDLGDSAGKSGSKLDGFAGKLGISAGALKAGLGAAAIAAIPAIVAFGKASVKAASDLNEQLSQSAVVFGQSADRVIEFGDAASASIGLSQRAALEAANDFGLLFTNLGKTTFEAAEMSQTLTVLAADLASFKNTSVEDAVAALGSALRGENEPLTRYGVFLNDAVLKQEAAALGLIKYGGALDAASKSQAAYSLIMQQTTTAQGDFARTSDGLAGTQKTISAEFEDLKAKLGDDLLPAVVAVAGELVKFIDGISRGIDSVKDFGGALRNAADNFYVLGKASADQVPYLDRFIGTLNRLPGVSSTAGKSVADIQADFEAAEEATDTAVYEHFVDVLGEVNLHALIASRGLSAYGLVADQVAGKFARLALAQGKLVNSALGTGPQPDFLRGSFTKPHEAYIDGLDVGDALGSGIGAGVSESLAPSGSGGASIGAAIDDVGNYLQALARQQVEDLNDIFDSIGSSISLDRVSGGLADARKDVDDLRHRLATIGGEISNQDAEIGRLLAESIAVTPEEQVAIERAEKELERVKAAYEGFIETTTNPSSFAGNSSTSSRSGPSATLAELQVAEQRLAEARRASTAPTNELIDAQRKLADLREEQLGLADKINDAERDLVEAEKALVDAKFRQIEAGKELANQGPEFIQQYRDLALAAGLAADEVDRLVAGIGASAQAAGLEDVFGNGTLFRTPEEARSIRNYIRSQNGEPPGFASGGIVGGARGSPQLIMAHGGETILPTHKGGGGVVGTVTINVSGAGDPSAVAIAVRNEFLKIQRRNGNAGFN